MVFCMYTNVRSIVNNCKLEEIKILTKMHNIDILGLTETWTNESISDAELSIQGFVLYRKDRVFGEKHRGGGVLLYVRDNLFSSNILDDTDRLSESLWISIKGEGVNDFRVGLCYRSPTITKSEEDILFAEIKHNTKGLTLLMRDFNFPDINWLSLQATSAISTVFLDLANDLFLTQHVLQSTRNCNILDLVFTTEENMIEEVEICAPISNSDHNTICFKLITKTLLDKSSVSCVTTTEVIIAKFARN